MDKKSIIAIVILAVLIIFYWPILQKLGMVQEPVAPEPTVDTVVLSPAEPSASQPAVPAEQLPAVTGAIEPSQLTASVEPDTMTVDTVVVETEYYIATLSSYGGGPISILLKDYTYRDSTPIEMITGGSLAVPEIEMGNFGSSSLYYSCSRQAGKYDATRDPLEVVYTYTGPAGGTIERRFTFLPEEHHFDLKINVDDPSVFGDRTYALHWNAPLSPTEPDLASDWTSMQVAAMVGGARDALDDFNDGRLRETVDGQVGWAGVRSTYFAAVLIPRNRMADGAFARGEERDVVTPEGGMIEERHITGGLSMSFAAVSPIADSFTVFVGPLDYMMMADYNAELEDMLDIGTTPYVGWIIKPFAIGVMWLLPKMYDVIPNYGVVIILFAFLVKMITLPLSIRQFKGMQAMKDLQPKIDEMKKKYKKDPQKLNAEMMKMYKANGVNPLSGCLPLLPQMPLFFALFSVFRSTILLREAPFFWFFDDLSRGASGLTDPYIVLVLLMIGAQFISQKLTMPANQQNKMLGYMMPLFMGFIFYRFAAGLVLYWTTFSALSMLDYAIFKRPKKNLDVKTVGQV